jgi:hypothetical protein
MKKKKNIIINNSDNIVEKKNNIKNNIINNIDILEDNDKSDNIDIYLKFKSKKIIIENEKSNKAIKSLDIIQIPDSSITTETTETTETLQNIEEYDDIIDIKTLFGKEIYYYNMLEKFFQNILDKEIDRMINIINGNNNVSLRFLDWFVTRYCYLYKLSIQFNNSFNKDNNFNINISYKAQLKSYKKKYFDPFRRKKKFFFIIEQSNKKSVILTTIGQLNFFRWAISNDVINYAETNYKSIILKFNHVNSYFKKNKNSSTEEENKSGSSNEELISNYKDIYKKNESKNPIVLRNINLEL